MVIRKATIEDAIPIADAIFLAMEAILYQFIGKKDSATAKALLLELVKMPDNQYSYEHCYVAVLDEQVAGAVLIYDGSRLVALREPVKKLIESRFGGVFNPEDETAAGEFYIDSLGVFPSMQGKQVGSQILQYLITEYTSKGQVLGLLVDKENPGAKKLYLRLGFRVVGEKELAGKNMEHLQYSVS